MSQPSEKPRTPLRWQKPKENRVQGERLLLGRIAVGEWEYDSTLPKETKAVYGAICKLPGIRRDAGHHESISEARSALEALVNTWIEQAGLTITQQIDTQDSSKGAHS